MAKPKHTSKHLHPMPIFALVIILVGIGWCISNYHFVPLERNGITPATKSTNANEEKHIMAVVQQTIPNNEINGIKVKLVFHKQMGKYAVVQAIPLNNETDPLQIILQKVSSGWRVIASGTAFPELEGKLPKELLR